MGQLTLKWCRGRGKLFVLCFKVSVNLKCFPKKKVKRRMYKKSKWLTLPQSHFLALLHCPAGSYKVNEQRREKNTIPIKKDFK